MKTGNYLFALMLCGYSMANPTGTVRAQTVERDTTITGPRGRTIQRQVEIQRTPGGIDRSIQIKRPGGTFERQTQIQRSPMAGRGFVPGMWARPAWGGSRPMLFAAPAVGVGLVAAPFMNFSFGGGGGGIGGGFGGGGMGGGAPGGPGAQPPPPPDQVALMCQRLQGFHLTGRKEAAYTLGQLGDPRAVPTLIHVLKYDSFKDVRIASAIALGEIGGSQAAVALERAAVYDHRDDVRRASATALDRLNTKAKTAASLAQSAAEASPPEARPPAGSQPSPPSSSTPSPFGNPPPATGPTPVEGESAPELSPPQGGLTPPPPPTPVASGPSGNP